MARTRNFCNWPSSPRLKIHVKKTFYLFYLKIKETVVVISDDPLFKVRPPSTTLSVQSVVIFSILTEDIVAFSGQ